MKWRAYFGSAPSGPFVSLSRSGAIARIETGGEGGDPLRLLDRALRGIGSSTADVGEIAVDRGPDGFSAVRRRIAAAASLSAALEVPLVSCQGLAPEEAAALPVGRFGKAHRISPRYSRPPNITVSKRAKPLAS